MRRGVVEARAVALRDLLASNKEDIMRVGGLWGRGLFIAAGGFAISYLGYFEFLSGDEPARRAAAHEPLRPGINFRPAAGPLSGCTQAPIDRSTGQTTPVDCPASRTATLSARLAGPPQR